MDDFTTSRLELRFDAIAEEEMSSASARQSGPVE